jgi:hypothetical protein
MGVAISWVAVRGKDPQDVLNFLGLVASGERQDIPEAPLTSAKLPSGWFLVFANQFGSKIASAAMLRELSAGATVVSCQVEEHIMFSSASSYSNGELTWIIEHDAQQGIYHIATRGKLPEQFEGILDRLRQEQDGTGGENSDTDYIHDAPIVLAQALTSFRHDQDIAGASEGPYEVLEKRGQGSAPAKKSKWKLW